MNATSQIGFLNLLQSCLAENNISLSDDICLLLHKYYQISVDWGKKMNITRNLHLENYIRENVLDPVLAFQHSGVDALSPTTIIDLGSGGGYVGITWSLLAPKHNYILIDSVRRKISFIDKVIRDLQLKHVQALHQRAETLSLNSSKFPKKVFVSRATWSWENYLKVCEPYRDQLTRIISFEGKASDHRNSLQPSQITSYEIKPFQITRHIYFFDL